MKPRPCATRSAPTESLWVPVDGLKSLVGAKGSRRNPNAGLSSYFHTAWANDGHREIVRSHLAFDNLANLARTRLRPPLVAMRPRIQLSSQVAGFFLRDGPRRPSTPCDRRRSCRQISATTVIGVPGADRCASCGA